MKLVKLLLFLLMFVNISFASDIYPFIDKRQEAQFQHLLKNLRCPVCQNQDLIDSSAPVAKDLRQEVYNMILIGKTDDEIINYLTDRFGDFILFQPKFKAISAFLWSAPLLFLSIGLLVFYRSVKGDR